MFCLHFFTIWQKLVFTPLLFTERTQLCPCVTTLLKMQSDHLLKDLFGFAVTAMLLLSADENFRSFGLKYAGELNWFIEFSAQIGSNQNWHIFQLENVQGVCRTNDLPFFLSKYLYDGVGFKLWLISSYFFHIIRPLLKMEHIKLFIAWAKYNVKRWENEWWVDSIWNWKIDHDKCSCPYASFLYIDRWRLQKKIVEFNNNSKSI